jgi:hypothetical protein
MNQLKVGDDKVKSALRDLSKLHRNPLIHPETSLANFDEAFALYCGVFTAMEAMLKEIPLPPAVQAPTVSGAVPPP